MNNDFLTDMPNVSASNALCERTRKLIPSQTMLLSKHPERFAPKAWPSYFKRAWGAKVEDVDGNVFVDFVGDVGATMLGRADPDVNAAVKQVVDTGNFCTMNYPGEIELAELLVDIIPCAQHVRYVRGGGEADVVAIRIARGFTKRDKVAICGYHGWHDWYLAANLGDNSTLDGFLLPGLRPLGVPRQLAGTTVPFEFNNAQSLRDLLESQPGEFAAVIMEVTRHHAPAEGFLEEIRDLATKHGTVLIFDEVVTGFRFALGGAQEYFGVTPDMATFAKTISNGYPMGAVVGRSDIMETVDDQFISSTYWTDAIGTAAALATLKKMQKINAVEYVWKLGGQLGDGLRNIISRVGIDAEIQGWAPLTIIAFRKEDSDMVLAMKTFYTRRQLSRGFLSGGHYYMTTAHCEEDITNYLAAAEESLKELKISMDRGTLMDDIENQPGRPPFKRLT